MTPTPANNGVTGERLEEMLAGLEGVTPGPWVKGRRGEHLPVNGPCHEVGSPTRGIGTSMYAPDACHIARCDPDTMRSILTELIARRAADTGAVGVYRAALAKEFHDGPLMADDHEFVTDSGQGKWCLDVVDFFVARLSSLTKLEAGAAEPVGKLVRVPRWTDTGHGYHELDDRSAIVTDRSKGAWVRYSDLAAAPPAPQPSLAGEVSEGARDVLAERQRQVEVEGWTHEHDDQHTNMEMAYAASAYLGPVWMAPPAVSGGDFTVSSKPLFDFPPIQWAWHREWWKPGGDSAEDYRWRLVRGAALALAEIERLDRAEALSQALGSK